MLKKSVESAYQCISTSEYYSRYSWMTILHPPPPPPGNFAELSTELSSGISHTIFMYS